VILRRRRADISGAHRDPAPAAILSVALSAGQTAIKLTAALYRSTPGTLNRKRQLEQSGAPRPLRAAPRASRPPGHVGRKASITMPLTAMSMHFGPLQITPPGNAIA